jgi:hypothetical protein
VKEVGTDCADDVASYCASVEAGGGAIRKFCKGITQGQGRILACLKSRQADLSPACQTVMGK